MSVAHHLRIPKPSTRMSLEGPLQDSFAPCLAGRTTGDTHVFRNNPRRILAHIFFEEGCCASLEPMPQSFMTSQPRCRFYPCKHLDHPLGLIVQGRCSLRQFCLDSAERLSLLFALHDSHSSSSQDVQKPRPVAFTRLLRDFGTSSTPLRHTCKVSDIGCLLQACIR